MAPYQRILPNNANALEVAQDKVAHEITRERLPIALRTLDKPFQIRYDTLPWLAWGRSVDFWRSEWSEFTKRKVTQDAYADHAMKGTVAGIRKYLSYVNASLIDYQVHPQRAFYSAKLTEAQYNAWTANLLQIRVYYHSNKGKQPKRRFFGRTYYAPEGKAVYTHDVTWQYLGRKAYVYDPFTDHETPLVTYGEKKTVEYGSNIIPQSVALPGVKGPAVFFTKKTKTTGRTFYGQFAKPATLSPRLITFNYEQLMVTRTAFEFEVKTLQIDEPVINLAPRRVAVKTPGRWRNFYGSRAAFFNRSFYHDSEPATNYYDLFYLNSPDRPLPIVRGHSFMSNARYGMQPYIAELLVRARGSAKKKAGFFSGGFFGANHTRSEDKRYWRDALAAIRASKSLRDSVKVDFETTKFIDMRGAVSLDGTYTLGQRIDRKAL